MTSLKVDPADVIRAAALIPAGTAPLMKPGVVARLGPEMRAVLAAIRSDDACIRNPSPKMCLGWVLGPEERRGRRSKRWSA